MYGFFTVGRSVIDEVVHSKGNVEFDFEEEDFVLSVVVERLNYSGRPKVTFMLSEYDVPGLVVLNLLKL